MKIASISSENAKSAEWMNMVDGVASTTAVASVATVVMADIASAPSRAGQMPESFLANQASMNVNAPATTRGGGRGR